MQYTCSFNRLFEMLPITAKVKVQPQDFIVEEQIPFVLSGEGEHCWLYIQKQSLNTDDVAQKLAKFAGVKSLAIGYAGLKDKQAVTSQWFSVQLPGKTAPQWQQLESEQLQILKSTRHSRKLQRGALSKNSFKIRLRDVSTSAPEIDSFALLAQRCEQISKTGVPNYFGLQRFGRGLNNLNAATALFESASVKKNNRKRNYLSRHQRSLYISSARSWLFNHILSTRIAQRNWNQRIAGDVFILDGKTACFTDDASALLKQRLAEFEIHPTAALWGEGDTMASADCAELEMSVINQFPVFRDGLVAARVQAGRRALRLRPAGLSYQRQENDFLLHFQLPAGAYATVVLDELLDWT